MRKDLILVIAGVLLVALCCAGPLILGAVGATLLLAAVHAHLAVIVAPLAVAALVVAVFVVRARCLKVDDDSSGAGCS